LIRRVNYELESEDWHNLNIWIQLLLCAINDSIKAIERVYPNKELSDWFNGTPRQILSVYQ